MNRIKVSIASINVQERQRVDLGDIDELANSLQHYGLIQPIIVNQDLRLIAGERRLRAAEKLGWKEIDIVYRETLGSDELHELELEENVRRKSMSWQERCLNITTIHRYKIRRGILDNETWGQQQTGELLGISVGHINNALALAADLKNKDSVLWKIDNISDALRLLIERRENAGLAYLASLSKPIHNNTPANVIAETKETLLVKAASNDPTLLERERERYYSNPHNTPGSFDLYWSEKVRAADEADRTVYLSTRVYQGDCIEVLRDLSGSFDHIITDPPYGIDMDMLSQENQGMVDIHTVTEEHDVEDNVALFKKFFPAAYAAMKDVGFLVAFCDAMQWQLLYDLATSAGFAVQRWPIVWVKGHICMNNASQYNYTKTTEFTIVCRKGNAVLASHAATSHIVASHDDLKEKLGHPFVKPFKVWEFILDHVSQPGQTILDPFAGRGSGTISAIRKGRNFFAVEKNVEHFNALVENLKQHYFSVSPKFLFK
jgi:ParB family chromosome partitioning protein